MAGEMLEFRYPDTAMIGEDDLILSIHPVHANRIYTKEKTFELRKSLPTNLPKRVFLYEGNCGAGITGHFTVSYALTGTQSVVVK